MGKMWPECECVFSVWIDFFFLIRSWIDVTVLHFMVFFFFFSFFQVQGTESIINDMQTFIFLDIGTCKLISRHFLVVCFMHYLLYYNFDGLVLSFTNLLTQKILWCYMTWFLFITSRIWANFQLVQCISMVKWTDCYIWQVGIWCFGLRFDKAFLLGQASVNFI